MTSGEDHVKTTRRAVLIGGMLAAFPGTPLLARTGAELPVADFERRIDGRIGFAALRTRDGAWLQYRAEERFAMCSTFNLPLAALVLRKEEAGRLSLEQRVNYSAADLLDYAPVTRANLAQGWMTVGQLCAAAVEQSDNTAANLLLRLVGGPAAFTRFVRAIGDPVARLDRIEPDLNRHAAGDPRDTTTPAAMAGLFAALLTGTVLRAEGRAMLARWMERAQPGRDRLRAGLPATWRSGSKTGTGPNGEVNDVVIAWPPGQSPILIACFVEASAAAPEERAAVQAEIARRVVLRLS